MKVLVIPLPPLKTHLRGILKTLRSSLGRSPRRSDEHRYALTSAAGFEPRAHVAKRPVTDIITA